MTTLTPDAPVGGEMSTDALLARDAFDRVRACIARGKRLAAAEYRNWQQMESALNDAQCACGRLTQIPHIMGDLLEARA